MENNNTEIKLGKLNGIDVVDMEITVYDACHLLSITKHDHLPVIDLDGNIFGMLSPIDILRFLDGGGNPNTCKAWEICSHNLVTADADSSPEQIAKKMLKNEVHHLLLKDGDKYTGICSFSDIAEKLLDTREP